RGAAGGHGDHRLLRRQGVPEGRGDDRPVHPDRRQSAATQPEGGDAVSVPDADTVLVVDFGAQYAQLIARRVREAHVRSAIVSRDSPAQESRRRRPTGIVLSGAPASVSAEDACRLDSEVLDLGVPVLGICYGHQLLADLAGGVVLNTDSAEYGKTPLEVTGESVL